MPALQIRHSYLAAALALAAALSGCAQPMNEPSSTGAKDTGTYPNLNIKPGVAAQQLTDAQTSGDTAALRGAQKTNAAQNSAVPNDEALLRRLAKTHAQDTLDKIEGGN